MQKPCPLNILKVTVIVLSRKIGHGQWMTPRHFEVIRLNFNVTVAFYAKNISAQYLEEFLSDSHGTW